MLSVPSDVNILSVVAYDHCGADADHHGHHFCSPDADRLADQGWVRAYGPVLDDPVLGAGWKSIMVRVDMEPAYRQSDIRG